MALALSSPEIRTPAFLVERAAVRRNCDAMREKARRSEVIFRPHVKTHKTAEIARMQFAGGAGPITVSTLAEAEFFAAHGFSDVTYAVPISPDKLARAAELGRRLRQFNVLIDSSAALNAMEEFHRGHGHVFDVFLKVDCGYHRAGVDPESPDSVRMARAIATSAGARFHGLLTHAGHSYNSRSIDQMKTVAVAETGVVTRFRARLAEEGIAAPLRSTGSTPTASVVERFTDTDEVRPGNYVFYDAFQATIGSCSVEDVAVSVLATVIGSYPQHGHLLVDAGALALSKDAGPDHVDNAFGFGIVCDTQLGKVHAKMISLSQEHGKISAGPEVMRQFPVGSRLRIIPNHSCLTAAMFDSYAVVENGSVVAQWKPVRGW